mmetsp:Transcript_1987/g.5933  ORF Transcript_1987/g.5933 Transcript_1987/m.5933 type:complete len:412 (-) Transcript_1987:2041-3276(-)|eukprot:CAMPEP_0198737050 /NCGR_PEP_ID=MMETSP1475-20131203/67669_1 /TAXON_ID= ORGANISM="Unidentified sp., Strain CCMP1999" /NCGR_SAMPLE_ID=MMETSP1475 /ASSEMBLY_ACC=CAM_ASM_001111 /LENGTH=411 /DNA_ID=CAMNT_0044500907 /DNA_START=12 /DNA_END=1247 /DNA_ORIENTATION=-
MDTALRYTSTHPKQLQSYVLRHKKRGLFAGKLRQYLDLENGWISIYKDETMQEKILSKQLTSMCVSGDHETCAISIIVAGESVTFHCGDEQLFQHWFLTLRRLQYHPVDLSKLSFFRFYTMEKVVVKERTYELRKCYDTTTKQRYMVKVIQKSVKHMAAETSLLQELDHENVVKPVDIFVDPQVDFVILDIHGRQDLLQLLGNAKKFSEQEAKKMFEQIIRGVQYLHQRDIVHCNLRPESILCSASDEPLSTVITDFTRASRHQRMPEGQDNTYSLQFAAPEVLRGEAHTKKADVWTCGVNLFVMLTGFLPFYGETEEAMLEGIEKGASFEHDCWNRVDPSAKNLVKALLNMDPQLRPDADDILYHEWMLHRMLSDLELFSDQKQRAEVFHEPVNGLYKRRTLRALFKRMS